MTTVNTSAYAPEGAVDAGATAEELTQTRGLQPRALIVTIYGLYAREVGGWLSVSALIQLMAEVGVEEPAVRSSISRLKRRGILQAERFGGSAGYSLSESARLILDEGDRRIFERPHATASDGWLLAVFSVPESERQRRHTLRSRLSWLGFGTVSAGVWIAPAHLGDQTRDVLLRHGLAEYVDLFRADHLGFDDVADGVAKWWDLAGLQTLYDEFLAAYGPVSTRWRRRRSPKAGADAGGQAYDAAAFADYVRTLTAWRRLPFLDPGLPATVLPSGWSGARAADLFFDLRDRLEQPAHRHVEAVTAAT